MKTYDSDLQMYVEKPLEPNISRLLFMRWLVQNGQGEHLPAGLPSGPYRDVVEHCATRDERESAVSIGVLAG